MTRGSEPGYRRQPKVYRLVFDEHPGLIVRARSASVAMVLEVTELQNATLDQVVAEQLFRLFAAQLLSWNLETEEGEQVPATYEGLVTEEWEFVLMIIMSWMEAVTGVSAPLDQPSNGGGPSLVESLPMELLSPSRAS